MDVKATRRNHWDSLTQPGDYLWSEPRAGQSHPAALVFICPCGCGQHGSLFIRPTDPPNDHPSWEWDGDLDCPTLTPSIQRNTGCRWHGYLTAGVFRSC